MEYAPATEAKLLRAALEQAESELRELRTAIERAVKGVKQELDFPGTEGVCFGEIRQCVDDLEAALNTAENR